MVDIPNPGYSQETVDTLISLRVFESRVALGQALWLLTLLGELAVGVAVYGVRAGDNAWPVVVSLAVAALPGIAGEVNLRCRVGIGDYAKNI